MEYSEETFVRSSTNDSFIVRSYPDLEWDSIWRYSIDSEIVAIYTGESIENCVGTVELRFFSGELHGAGQCLDGYYHGMWKFYRKSGNLHSKGFFLNGKMYQRWYPFNGDTLKLVRPIIEVDPKTAFILDTVKIRVNYIFDGIDTSSWDYYLHFDFIALDKFKKQESLPYENYIEKFKGEEIKNNLGFMSPGDFALYGYTLAINRETGDSISHLGIETQYVTILDSTSVDF